MFWAVPQTAFLPDPSQAKQRLLGYRAAAHSGGIFRSARGNHSAAGESFETIGNKCVCCPANKSSKTVGNNSVCWEGRSKDCLAIGLQRIPEEYSEVQGGTILRRANPLKPLVISVFAVLPTSPPKQLVIIAFAGKGEAKTAWLSGCSAFRRNIQIGSPFGLVPPSIGPPFD